MANTPQKAVVTAWLLDLVQSRLSLATPVGQKIGDGRAEGSPLIYPYHVLYSITGGSISGPPLGQAQGDAVLVYQIDSVGRTRDQAERAGDRLREWVVGRTPAGVFVVQVADPDGHAIHDRIVDGTPGAPLQEGQPPNEVFTVSDSIGIHVTVK